MALGGWDSSGTDAVLRAYRDECRLAEYHRERCYCSCFHSDVSGWLTNICLVPVS